MLQLRPFSPWWVVVAAPVALGVGWLAGGMSVPGRPEAVATAPSPRSGSPAAPDPRDSPIEPQAPFLGASSSPGPRTDQIFSAWTTYDDAVRQSRENGKPVLLDFNADWCGPCQALRREVFEAPGPSVTVEAAVIPVSLVDRMRENGANPPQLDELQRRFAVEAFPTLVVFSPGSGRSERLEGFAGASETLRWITETAAALR